MRWYKLKNTLKMFIFGVCLLVETLFDLFVFYFPLLPLVRGFGQL